MFERFTDRARKVMALANQETQRLNHEYIGTEHILMGLVKEGSGVGANVLKNLDVDLAKVRLAVEKLVKPGPPTATIGKLPQTPRAKKVIKHAIEEARKLNHNYVGTEHLLLGLLGVAEGVAARVLTNLGLGLEDVRKEVLNLLGIAQGSPIGEVQPVTQRSAATVSAYERSLLEPTPPRIPAELTQGLGLALLPQGVEFVQLFDSAIVPAMRANEMSVTRVDDLYSEGCDLSEIRSNVRSAEVIVADLSGSDSGVLYQVGLCHALFRCPILLVRDSAQLPHGLRSIPHLEYKNDTAGVDELRRDLSNAITEFLAATRNPDVS